MDVLSKLADGSHPFAKRLSQAKAPVVIVGSECLQGEGGTTIYRSVQKLAEGLRAKSGCPEGWRVLNVLHRVASQVRETEDMRFRNSMTLTNPFQRWRPWTLVTRPAFPPCVKPSLTSSTCWERTRERSPGPTCPRTALSYIRYYVYHIGFTCTFTCDGRRHSVCIRHGVDVHFHGLLGRQTIWEKM